MKRVIIAGAGVVGLFTALVARERGWNVIVYEKEKPGAGASTKNAGVLHLIQPPPGKLRRKLAPLGARVYRKWAGKVGFDIYETSLIIPAVRAREQLLLPLLGALIRRISMGVARPRIVDKGEALRLEPSLNPSTIKALVVKGYGIVDPSHLIESLVEYAEAIDVVIARGIVEAAVCSQEGVKVLLESGEEMMIDYFINAAGAGGHEIAARSGVHPPSLKLIPGTMALYKSPQPENIIAHPPLSLRPKSKGGAIIPWPWREATLLGPSFAEKPIPPQRLAEKYRPLLREEPNGLQDTIIGYRTVCSKRDFQLLQNPQCPQALHLLCIESPGLTAAPTLAEKALNIIKNKIK